MKPGDHNRRPERRQPVVPADLYAGFRWPWFRITGDAWRILGTTTPDLRDRRLFVAPLDGDSVDSDT